ncbi:MAG: anaerobic ribonucleoside-triphosphate reductase activating protein [Desulfosarcinaceae bacterium]|nr:anaerobic ribonucleoside-triphosphate reductase activating protein [Desulfosarcinaceae bacterium]
MLTAGAVCSPFDREKLSIGGFQPFSLSDFPGRAAAILFTQGCNFRCPYCHNRSLWASVPLAPPALTISGVLAFLRERVGRLGGVVVTGGEPTLQAALADLLEAIKAIGLAVKLDTNGARPRVIEALLGRGLVDYIAMDIKAPPEKYDLLCGCHVDLGAIRRSMALIAASGVAHHFRTTLYPPLLSKRDIAAIRKWRPPTSAFRLQRYQEPRP